MSNAIKYPGRVEKCPKCERYRNWVIELIKKIDKLQAELDRKKRK